MTQRLSGIVFDLDGVFYLGDQPIPGGQETLAWVRAEQIPHCFLTNATSRPRSALVTRLAGMGIAVTENEILTPAVAAGRWIAANLSGPIALFVPETTQCDFAGLPIAQPCHTENAEAVKVGAVVIGDLGEGWDFATLNSAFRLLLQRPAPALLALGMTRYWQAPDGPRLDVAPIVAALQHATGAEATVLGKPARTYFEMALATIGCEAAETIIVGDDIRSDIQAAQDAGLTGVLLRSGKFQASDLDMGIKPDAMLDSIADLPAWWESRKLDC